jgi:NDP-hexose-3-ketoreductase
VGVLGCSSIARRRFIPAILGAPEFSLDRIASRDVFKAKSYSEEFQCVKYGSYSDLLNDPDVEIVYISTPPFRHEQDIKDVIRVKKHVISEKPITQNLDSLIRLLDLADKHNVYVVENYAFLHHPQHAVVKNLIDAGELGEVQHCEVSFCYPMPPWNDIRLNPNLGAGVIHDTLGYPIALTRFLFGDDISVCASKICFDENCAVSLSAQFTLNVVNTFKVHCKVAMGEEYESRYRVHTESGYIEVGRAFSVDENYRAEVKIISPNECKLLSIPPQNQIRNFLAFFAKVLQANSSLIVEKHNQILVRSIMDEVLRLAS